MSKKVTLREHYDIIRELDYKFQEERDRRYTEVNIEKEKALKIKETADLAALGLAREIQTYKDEKANQLREQINSERGLYATKDDVSAVTAKLEAIIKPLAEYVSSQQGRSGGIGMSWAVATVLAVLVIAVLGLYLRH
jgi:hypothetical protein